jgi:hypothetical protein
VTVANRRKPPPTKVTEAQKATEAANSVKFTGNAEIENIKRRLELTSDPGLLGFIVLMNDAGQPVMYTSVKGKVTSGAKRLTPTQQVQRRDTSSTSGGYAFQVVEAPGDEGTHGSSAPYIFFWTEDGQYIQWSGQYLYSDKPFRLDTKPLVVGVQPLPGAYEPAPAKK